MVANPARGQLNRETEHFPVPVRASLARQVIHIHISRIYNE